MRTLLLFRTPLRFLDYSLSTFFQVAVSYLLVLVRSAQLPLEDSGITLATLLPVERFLVVSADA